MHAEDSSEQASGDDAASGSVEPESWLRFAQSMGDVLTAFGMDADTPGAARTHERFLRGLEHTTHG
jgi:hypothetical protein